MMRSSIGWGVNEAEANIASMQRYLSVLHAAYSTYMVANENTSVNVMVSWAISDQDALARFQVIEIIQTTNDGLRHMA
jgi:hypothetical protein